MKNVKLYKWISYFFTFVMVVVILSSMLVSAVMLFRPEISSVNYSINLGVLVFQSNEIIVSNLFLIPLTLNVLLITLLIWNIRCFFKNLSKKSIFVIQNAKLITSTGIILVIMSVTANLAPFIAVQSLVPYLHNSLGEIVINYSVRWELVMGAIPVIVLGILFKEAVKIAQENELTI